MIISQGSQKIVSRSVVNLELFFGNLLLKGAQSVLLPRRSVSKIMDSLSLE